jgi:Fe-S-cluster containining protein
MDNPIQPLSPDDKFRFECSKDVPCFNACCRDLNQFLTPYDILRLKNHLGITSGTFIEKYTIRHIGPETGLPVITLKPLPESDLQCPFVTPAGCSVYPSRPSSCRIYPLARAITRNRETGKINEHFALLKESHCCGFQQQKMQTVREWMRSQEVADCNRINDIFLEIISLKARLLPGPLDLRSKHLFHIALYDIDAFKKQIFEGGLADDMRLDGAYLEVLKKDEVELLKFGHQLVKKVIFGNNCEQ